MHRVTGAAGWSTGSRVEDARTAIPVKPMLMWLIPVAAYLLGSIPSAVIVTRAMGLPDPRSMGSRNPGATNVLRTGHKGAAALTLAGDVLKGVFAVIVTRWITDEPGWIALAGLLAFVGHLYPLFLGFRGGKGVATALGVSLGFSLVFGVLLAAIWLGVALTTRYSSLAAVVAGLSAPLCAWWLLGDSAYVVMTSMMALLLLWRHRGNLRRLRTGTEPKIGRT